MSDIDLRPIHKFFRVTISSIKYAKNTNSDFINLLVYFISPYKITLHLNLLEFCETNATLHSFQEKAYRVKHILEVPDICQSNIVDEELRIQNFMKKPNQNTNFSIKLVF